MTIDEDDLENKELLKEADDAANKFKEMYICDGLFYSQQKGVVVEHQFGKIVLVNPDLQEVSKQTLCKLKDALGLHYEQNIVKKIEDKVDILHVKGRTKELFTLDEIINKHNAVWIDSVENERKGMREELAEKILRVDNYHLENSQKSNIDYEKNTNLNAGGDEITTFYSDQTEDNKGYRKINSFDFKLNLRRNESSNPADEGMINTKTSSSSTYEIMIRNITNLNINGVVVFAGSQLALNNFLVIKPQILALHNSGG